jgi:hypothetical protein
MGSLQAAATRYGQVSSALSGWVPDLEEAQTLSLRALNLAEGPTTLSCTFSSASGSCNSTRQDGRENGLAMSSQTACLVPQLSVPCSPDT